MKKTTRLMLSAVVAGAIFLPAPAYAVNEADCAIWLCLPSGFTVGCGEAKKAFVDRIKKFKPPIPSLSSCLVSENGQPNQGNEMTAKNGKAAFIPEKIICVKWGESHNGKNECARYETTPTRIVKDKSCVNRGYLDTTPKGCSHTIHYIDTYIRGIPNGETYYYDGNGSEVTLP